MTETDINENEIYENSERKNFLEDLWENTPVATVKVENETNPEYFGVFVKSNTEYERLPVKVLPINLMEDTGLWYNPYNSRILAYKLQKEAEFAAAGTPRKLDSSIKEDRMYIHKVLLTSAFYSGQATEDLEKELEDTGQIEPAIISADGIIWNANRRIAIRHKLYEKTGDSKWNKVKAVKLPSLRFKELKQLEHRLQMAKEFREEYGSVNLRLRCRQAITPPENWSMNELINSFHYKYKKAQIEKFIEEIVLIDEFLEFTKSSSDYPNLETKGKGRGVEIFSALNDQLKWEISEGTDDADIEKIKYVGFSIIHNKDTTYKFVRNFRNILRKQITRDSLLENSLIYQDPAKYTITIDPSVSPLALKPDTTKAEVENLIKETAVFESLENTPAEVSNEVLKKLQTVNLDQIDGKNIDFQRTITQIIQRTELIMSKCTLSEQEKKKILDVLESFTKKIK